MRTAARTLLSRNVRFSSHQFRSYRVAIVGSGPSGCYTAKYLQTALDKQEIDHQIHIMDRLPTPYGLVRYGVAPDHPEVKNVQNDFDSLFERCQFWGNVELGKDIQLTELRERFDAVVLAYGCEGDQKLSIPGYELPGVLSARQMVAWYNGHPDFTHVGDEIQKYLGTSNNVRTANVVIIGQGNVALDCARVLAKGGSGLFDTDLASHALEVLGDGVQQVSVVGRRGHVQGAFTIKELRELVKLRKEGYATNFVVALEELEMGATESSMAEMEQGRPKKRIDTLLRDAASVEPDDMLPKRVDLRFLLNPIRLEADTDGRLASVIFERSELQGEPGQQKAIGTGETISIPAQMVLVSIGYKGLCVPGLEPWFQPSSGLLSNQHGVVDHALYTAGWLKRGPSGIIGTNISDAKDTVKSLLAGLQEKAPMSDLPELGTMLEARGTDYVDWKGYQKIVSEENRLRRSEAQPREKIVSKARMVQVAQEG